MHYIFLYKFYLILWGFRKLLKLPNCDYFLTRLPIPASLLCKKIQHLILLIQLYALKQVT